MRRRLSSARPARAGLGVPRPDRGRRGLHARLGRLFAGQLLVIGAATVGGIYITQVVVEDLLTRRALEMEASHFWRRHAEDPAHALPDTANMRGYLGGGDVPGALAGQAPGFRRLPVEGRSRLVHVSDRGDARLYLVFNADQVSDLAFYFGILPLSVVLLLIYLMLFIAYRWSSAALSPLVRLARELETVDFARPGSVRLNLDGLRRTADAEVATMIDALDRFTARLDAAIERERVFTRDAGHELRTPLAVFKGSLDLLERDAERPRGDRDALARMRRTATEMESLLETLLALARESGPAAGSADVGAVVGEETAALEDLARQRRNRVRVRCEDGLVVAAPPQVIHVIVGNLLRNALAHTENGEVEVTASPQALTVSDTGSGMSAEELSHAFEPFYRGERGRDASRGHGLGLSIVRRLTRQYGWTLNAHSSVGQGTTVTVGFSDAAAKGGGPSD